jgi:hypothetical protein
MVRKLILGSVWLTLITYAIASTSTKTQQGDWELIIKMSTGNFVGINPLIIAIFYIMGIFPVIYAAFILFDSNQRLSPYPFSIASFGVGAFALLPYLALCQPDLTWNQPKNCILTILDYPLTAIATSVTLITLLIWGLTQGNWSDYVEQWHTSQFIHIMSIDFCLLCLLFPTVLGDDCQRRGVTGWLKAIAFIPLFGALIYWCLRPQLPVTVVTSISS